MIKDDYYRINPAVFRWSPYPRSHYLDSPNGAWLERLTDAAWNVVWLTSRDLSQKLDARYVYHVELAIPATFMFYKRRMTVGQAATIPADSFVVALQNARWEPEPPTLFRNLDQDVDRWMRKAREEAGGEHPTRIIDTMEMEAEDVQAANALLDLLKEKWSEP